jgi:hypothetical protein
LKPWFPSQRLVARAALACTLSLILLWVSLAIGLAAEGIPGATEGLRSFKPAKAVNYRVPERTYVITNLNGWSVHLEQELAEDQRELADKATQRLAEKLQMVLSLVPPQTHARLRRLPIFLLLGEESKKEGRDNGAEYFQKQAPDYWNWTDRRWGSSLVIYSARNYVWLSDEWAVRLLIHELAHAWHLEQWPEEQEDILAAWKHARANNLYLNVKAVNGTVIPRAYSIDNQLEYFAELSCAFFWRGEYEPFDRKALQTYDPVGVAMLRKMWGVPVEKPQSE